MVIAGESAESLPTPQFLPCPFLVMFLVSCRNSLPWIFTTLTTHFASLQWIAALVSDHCVHPAGVNHSEPVHCAHLFNVQCVRSVLLSNRCFAPIISASIITAISRYNVTTWEIKLSINSRSLNAKPKIIERDCELSSFLALSDYGAGRVSPAHLFN